MSTTRRKKNDRVLIFDTTPRDGEQCPGASMGLREKLEVARQLQRLKVDIIEAGFPVASPGDFEAVHAVATEIKGPVIAGLARCINKDIELAGEAVAPAGDRGRIHVFLATSAIHRKYKLKKAKEEIIKQAVAGFGAADKPQVENMVRRLLGLSGEIQSDASDALAIAVCHANTRRTAALLDGHREAVR